MYDMNQLFRVVQAVNPILTCKKNIFLFYFYIKNFFFHPVIILLKKNS